MVEKDNMDNDIRQGPIETYYEKKIGKTHYRVTSVYKGEIELSKALEDLIIRKILRDEK